MFSACKFLYYAYTIFLNDSFFFNFLISSKNHNICDINDPKWCGTPCMWSFTRNAHFKPLSRSNDMKIFIPKETYFHLYILFQILYKLQIFKNGKKKTILCMFSGLHCITIFSINCAILNFSSLDLLSFYIFLIISIFLSKFPDTEKFAFLLKFSGY